ncbi:RusA family crossover junction endodeoxyribonuclease, partial [Candidatus Kaiserbacteria bacterium]|nr:RusA family crossover junction endodeoxyribonuclease [Candidatus Kaiserbacteria bacterium]
MITFFVPGDPVGKGRPRFTSQGGRGRAVTPVKTRNYERQVATYAREAYKGEPLKSPVQIRLVVKHAVPDSWPVWKASLALNGQLAPTIKPDSSNVLKAVEDALNGIC